MADDDDFAQQLASLRRSDGKVDYAKLLEFLRENDAKIDLDRLYAVLVTFFDRRFVAEVNQYRQRVGIFKREARLEESDILEEYIRVKTEGYVLERIAFEALSDKDGKTVPSSLQHELDTASEILGKGANAGRTMIEARMRNANWPIVVRNQSVLLQVCLPRHDQGDYQAWEVQNGESTVLLRAGSRPDKDGRIVSGKLPWGKLPRLMLFYINTKVNADPLKQKTVQLGNSVSQFLERIGISRQGYNYDNFHEQLNSLLRCGLITNYHYNETGFPDAEMYPFSKEGSRTIYQNVSDQVDEFRDRNNRKEVIVTLSDSFYRSMLESPLHIKMDSIKALGKNLLAMDIFAMLAERLPRIAEGSQEEISREYLENLFGSGQEDKGKFFRESFKPALDLVLEKAYPEAKFQLENKKLILMHSLPATTKLT
jgi:hypothetical protein